VKIGKLQVLQHNDIKGNRHSFERSNAEIAIAYSSKVVSNTTVLWPTCSLVASRPKIYRLSLNLGFLFTFSRLFNRQFFSAFHNSVLTTKSY